MIQFRDFTPRMFDPGGLFTRPQYEQMHEVVRKVNEWIEAEAIRIIQIETVVLPSVSVRREAGPEYPALAPSDGERPAEAYQAVRVWFEARTRRTPRPALTAAPQSL